MRPHFRDLHDLAARAGTEVEWWDFAGTPRFAPFSPRLLGVYDEVAVLAEISCVSCGRVMRVAQGAPRFVFVPGRLDLDRYTAARLARQFDYGDPPRHGCPGAGETMHSEVARIVGAWERIGGGREWVRVPLPEEPGDA